MKDEELVIECSSDVELYFGVLDRRGLKSPTKFLIGIVANAYKTFQILISESNEYFFFIRVSSNLVLIRLITNIISMDLRELNIFFVCVLKTHLFC